MQAHNNNVEEYLSVPRTVFVVPVYQRNYDWKEENCKQLFYDIEKSIDTGREHFLGTICFKNTSAHERSIIDGQQRLTSITLLLKAIYDYTDDEDIKDEIKNTYIYNKGHSVDSDYLRVKLHLNKRDDATYHLLLENSYETVTEKLSNTQRDSRVYQNYTLFIGLITEYVEKKNGDLEDILEALRNLTIIELEIQQENPQEIFESLNSTGLDLTNVDLLRNYFLMQFSHQEQTHLYDEYWSQIEDSIGVSNMEQFFNDYLIYKKRSDAISINGKRQHITQRTLYTAFKDYYLSQGYESNYAGTESCFADLKRCAFLYKSLVFDSDVNLGKESYLRQRLYFIIYANEAIKSRCILLYLLDLHDNKLIDDEVLLKSVEAVLSLTFRAKMCKAKGINYQFAGNVLQRLGEIEDYSDFMNAFWKVLTFGKGSFAFPSNEEFREALTEKDLYLTIRSKGVKYLLYALEEKSPFPKGLPEYTDETITIEHVMPQTPTEKWKGYLSTSDLESYEVYLHRLGNLALTNYNSEMSNKSFDEKKGIYKGSKFYYTTKLSDVPKWSSAVISKRGGELADAALKVWELPEAYQETRATHDSVHTLDEDPKQYAYTKPKVLYVGENEFNVSSWSNILPIICGVMVDEDTKTFLEIAKPDVDKYFSLEDDDQTFADKPSYEHIINNVYIYTHNSAHGTITVASRLLKMFDEKAGTELYDNTLFTIK